MSDSQKIQSLLRQYRLRPSKRLGQNYLHDVRSIQKVVEAAELKREEHVLEVGSGIGNLTLELAKEAAKVWAVEIDGRFRQLLQDTLANAPNVELIIGDALTIELEGLAGGSPFKVAGNIPYQITSALLRRFLELERPPQRIVFAVQEEVADRIVAPPGELSLLAVSVLAYGVPAKLDRIPATHFYPVPQVDSAILRIDIHESPVIPWSEVSDFFRLVKAGFSQRRKQLQNSLAGGLALEKGMVVEWLAKAAISPQARAQELSLEDWKQLVGIMRASSPNG